MSKIKSLGQIIDQEARKPDLNMPTPDYVTKLQSFLGLANYYSAHIPKIHELRAPLN